MNTEKYTFLTKLAEQISDILSIPKAQLKFARLYIEGTFPCLRSLGFKLIARHGIQNSPFSQSGQHNLVMSEGIHHFKKNEMEFCYVHISNEETRAIYMFIVAKQKHIHRIFLPLQRLFRVNTEKPLLPENIINEVKKNSIQFLDNIHKLESYGSVKNTRGLLFHGPSGTGKSMLARYIGNLTGDYDTLNNAKLIDILNKQTDLPSRKVLIFDDVDVSMFNRSEKTNEACTLLNVLDEHSINASVRIFTTNEYVDYIDPAFLRPGRIDRVYQFHLPDEEQRNNYIQTWHNDIKQHINPMNLSRQTKDLNFAQLNEIRCSIAMDLVDQQKIQIDKYLKLIVPSKNKKIVGFGS